MRIFKLTLFLLASDIKLGAFYNPRLLPDYGGPFFAHVKSKLIQLDVRDGTPTGNNALIPPWKFYDWLKPGTLVMVQASLHIFLMTDTDFKAGNARPKKRKVHSVRVRLILVCSPLLAIGVPDQCP